MSASHASVASNGNSTVVSISSLAAQVAKNYSLLIVLFIFVLILTFSMSIACCIWLKKRRANTILGESDHAIPLATLNTLPSSTSPKPAPPVRDSRRPIVLPPFASASTATRPTQTQRSQSAGPPLPPKDRPILRKNQTHGADYSSGRPRRYGSTHLAQTGPSAPANVHNSSATESFGSKRMDKMNNS